MVYKIKKKQKEIKHKATILKIGYEELDFEAYKQFNSKFSELSDKEQKKISEKVAKQYYF